MHPGFHRDELRARYDVNTIREDEWHAYSGQETARFISKHVSAREFCPQWVMNAGAGIYKIMPANAREVFVDLFAAPISCRDHAVCANVQWLPFKRAAFGAVICVGEVLAYCDPAAAIAEFARVLAPRGLLICDFGNSKSIRHWFRPTYGRAADLVIDEYNGTPEPTWVYDPRYVTSVLAVSGFQVLNIAGIHTWSAVARRLGAPSRVAVSFQRHLDRLRLPRRWADVTTIAAVRIASVI